MKLLSRLSRLTILLTSASLATRKAHATTYCMFKGIPYSGGTVSHVLLKFYWFFPPPRCCATACVGGSQLCALGPVQCFDCKDCQYCKDCQLGGGTWGPGDRAFLEDSLDPPPPRSAKTAPRRLQDASRCLFLPSFFGCFFGSFFCRFLMPTSLQLASKNRRNSMKNQCQELSPSSHHFLWILE